MDYGELIDGWVDSNLWYRVEATSGTCESRALGSFTTSEFDIIFIYLSIIRRKSIYYVPHSAAYTGPRETSSLRSNPCSGHARTMCTK